MGNLNRILSIITLAVIFSLLLVSTGIATEQVLYSYDSVYHHIRVTQEGDIRGLRFDNYNYQSKMDINNPLLGYFGYVPLMFESFVFNPDIQSVLMFGLGGGSTQKLFHYYQPDLDILTVELDSAVVDVAGEYFYYDREQLPVEVDDARTWMRRNNNKYDLIIQDTYSSNAYGTFIPFHLATLEYFRLVASHLDEGGVFAINVIGTVYGGEPNRVITSVYKTMREVFPQLYLFAAKDVQNVVIVATQNEERMNIQDIQAVQSALIRDRRTSFPQDFQTGAFTFYDTAPSGLSNATILTDDFAPTDNLLR
jgi:spermidine synthase